MTISSFPTFAIDPVTDDLPCAREIGFSIPERYNAGEILFHNLDAGRAQRTAIYSPAGNATYGELSAAASRYAHGLSSLGLVRGDRVLLFLNDTASYPAAFFGAVRAGFVPILCNTLTPPDLLRFYLEDGAVSVAVADPDYAGLFETAAAGTPLKTLIQVGGARTVHTPFAIHDADEWLKRFPEFSVAADTHRNDMAFWMYSSGSTGRPKGIVHLQHDMAYTSESYAKHILGIREDDICFSVPKIFFAYGFGNSVTFPFSVGASSVLYPGRPEAAPAFDCIERFRPTLFFGLPTLYNALIGHPRAETADLSSVRLCLSAAEVLAEELFEAWKARFGHEILEGLGSTEVLHIYLSNTSSRRKAGSAGLPVPGYEVKLTTPDGDPVPRGEAGVMWVRGGSSAPTYWKRPEKTAETMRDGWIWTGDRLVEDREGFFTFAGRVDDLIKVSGQWVYPLEIELTLFEHAAVKECAVVAFELPDRRMTLKAFVVVEDGVITGDALSEELKAFVKSRLLPFKYPRTVQYLTNLPKTGTGKIDRQALLRAKEPNL
jgi:acetyl-CoA synthetase